jgi:simple sugar transport system permease protein
MKQALSRLRFKYELKPDIEEQYKKYLSRQSKCVLDHIYNQKDTVLLGVAADIGIIKKTNIGLSLRSVGENPATADAAGLSVSKFRYFATMIGGAIAALGGLFYIMDYLGGSVEYTIDKYGWMAVALVIFSMWNPSISIFGSFIFGALYIMPSYLDGLSFADKELIKLTPYVVTIMVLVITSLFNRKETQPPSALGLTYFREDR